MSRLSADQYVDGKLMNGFDYDNQCWIINGIIQNCGHPEQMQCRCFGRLHAGKYIQEAR